MVKGLWRSVWVESGALCVIIAGINLMQQSSVNSWDSREQVCVCMFMICSLCLSFIKH